jgi:cyanophycinase
MSRHRFPRLGAALVLFLIVSTYAGWLNADQAPVVQPAPIAEHLSPYGLQGAVIAVGGDKPSESAITRFVELAGGEKAEVVVVVIGTSNADSLLDALKGKKTANLVALPLKERVAAGSLAAVQALRKATGVWLVATGTSALAAELVSEMAVEQELRDVRLRGGVVAASGVATPLLGETILLAGSASRPSFLPTMSGGLGVFPGTAIEVGNAAQPPVNLDSHPGLLGVKIPDGSALFVRGRDMRTIGDKPVTFHLPKTNTREARVVEAKGGKAKVDYNEMRRAAMARAANPQYPPKELPVPEVPSGTLVIVGGGSMPADVTQKFIEAGGGVDGHFVVLPISNPDPIRNDGGGFLRQRGCKDVTGVVFREQKDLEDPKTLEIFKKATGIWFGGGRQWNFVDAYEGTKIPELMWDVLRRGGVIGGSSAGATIQGDYLVRGAPAGPNIMMCEGYEKSMGFLPGVAIDQHFTQRNRFKDMTALVNTYPQFLGIALDEATAVVVKGHVADVMGNGTAHFYDRRKPVVEGQPDYEALKAGGKYDLKERKILVMPEKK